ncbi:fimbrial biogenesis chaperone [Enterobacter asburiae]
MNNNIVRLAASGFKYALLSLTLFGPVLAQAGVVIGGTRVVYDSSKREAALSVKNPDKSTPYLIQSWVENSDVSNTAKAPFIITPPLFRLDAGQENVLRIVRSGGDLPKDRESVYWLNVKSIPGTQKSEDNQLQISVKARMKLIYRPAGLKGSVDNAYQQLQFSRAGNTLNVSNPTPYFVSFYSLTVAGKEIKNPGMVAPLSQQHWTLPGSVGGQVSWKAINDFGAVTAEKNAAL